MELVYLWVENYKNIHEQGFNFSPKFNCHYDGETLTIKENIDEDGNKKYIENFFGDNINVTAIVGKNGSGKSNILKLLYKGLHDYDFYGFAIFSNKDEIFFLKGLHDRYPFLDSYQNLFESTERIKFPLFDYSYTYDINSMSDNELKYPKKRINNFNGIIDLRRENIRNQQNILRNYFNLVEKKQLFKFDKFFMPKIITIYFNPSTIKVQEGKNIPNFKKESENVLTSLINSISGNISFRVFYNKLKEVSNLLNNNNSFNPRFILGIDELNDDLDIYYNSIWHQKAYNTKLEKLSSLKTIQFSDENPYEDDYSLKILSFSIEKLDADVIDTILASFSSNHFLINLYDKDNKKLSDLSFGEQQLLFILNQIFTFQYLLTPNVSIAIMSKEGQKRKRVNKLIILLDEIDISFHPDWQKRTIQYILDFLKLIPNTSFHLIFTTHSPFLLSDISNENIIFLGSEPSFNQTFGANIHTLLSDSFFMEGGLMGEFAKQKINEIIAFFKKENEIYKDDKEKLLKIINTIGEPFLKDKLLFMYNEKYPKTKEEEIAELEELEDKLKRLKKNG